jgi:hypothetical protein
MEIYWSTRMQFAIAVRARFVDTGDLTDAASFLEDFRRSDQICSLSIIAVGCGFGCQVYRK